MVVRIGGLPVWVGPTDLVAGMRGDALLAPATRTGYVQFGQLGHWVSLPGGG